MLKYLKHKEIDFQKWDRCIASSLNPDIYAFSWYLDCIFPNWSAVVEDDYESVAPVFYNKYFIFGFAKKSELIPLFKIYSPKNLNFQVTDFYKVLPGIVRLTNVSIKNDLQKKENSKSFNLFYADLISKYTENHKKYSNNIKVALENALKEGYFCSFSPMPADFINFVLRNTKKSKKEINLLRKIISVLMRKNAGVLLGIYSQNNSLEGVSLFSKTQYESNLILTFTKQGKQHLNIVMIDHFIRNYSEKPLTLNIYDNNKLFSELNHSEFERNKLIKVCKMI